MDLGAGDSDIDDAGVMGLQGLLQCEPPNANLHQFQGRFEASNGLQPSGESQLPLPDLEATFHLMGLRILICYISGLYASLVHQVPPASAMSDMDGSLDGPGGSGCQMQFSL